MSLSHRLMRCACCLLLGFNAAYARTDPCAIDEFAVKDGDGTERAAVITKDDTTHTGTITVVLPGVSDGDARALAPRIVMRSPQTATISPGSGAAVDMTKAVVYTVDCKDAAGKAAHYTYRAGAVRPAR